jgi:LuxR family maltose regulon positive regulatory protein
MSEGMILQEAVPGGSQRPGDMEEAWQRLLSLEREVKELRRLLLADAAPTDVGVTRPALVPTPFDARMAATRVADWRVTCLGSFQLTCGGQVPPPCSSRRGWGILQYLLVRPGYLATRDTLIEAFWPGAEPYSGAHSLQMAIHALRRALRGCGPDGSDDAILFRDGQYGINPALVIDLDVDRFRAACAHGRQSMAAGHTETSRRAFEEALALYGGPFLPESSHDDWAEPHRVALQDLRLNVLGWLSSTYAARADWEYATTLCREILAADPYREDAIRQLLSGLAASGRLAEVERTYRACRERIWQDLQVEPAPETVRLYHQLTRSSLRPPTLSGLTGS